MRRPRTLFRYVLREVGQYTALGFVAFAGILIAQNLLRRLDDLTAVGFTAQDALAVVGWLFSMLAAYAFPVAFLFGVLVAVGRLSADAEVTALRACGLGLRVLLAPVLLLAAGVAAVTGVLMIEVEPTARLSLRATLKEVASRGAILEPGKFRSLAGRVVYVQDRDRDNNLRQVLVADRSDPQRPFVIVAEKGHFRFDAERLLMVLDLERGDLHLGPRDAEDLRQQRISFERFRYAIDATPILEPHRSPRPREMHLGELRQAIEQAEAGTLPAETRVQNVNAYRMQLHRRLALPLAPIAFALIGVPLALRRRRGARSWGTLLCVLLVVAYYALLSFGQFVGENGHFPVALAIWLPNLAFGAVAAPLLVRARHGEA